MNTSAAGIGFSLWLRIRWVLVGLVIYFVVLATVVQLLPAPMMIAITGTLIPCSAVAHLLTVFTLGPADLGVRGSGFPKHMFVLPLRTRTLVRWPMLFGAAFMAFTWMVVALFILRPGGLNVPVLWPAALGAAGTAWLQAIGWSPFPSPFARVPALAVAITPLILLGACAGLYLESQSMPWFITLASFVWILGAYLFAVQGLSRARAGSEGDWLRQGVARVFARLRARRIVVADTRPPFRSPSAAQLWYDCRRNAIVLPMMFSFVSLPMLVLILPPLFGGDASKSLMFGSTVLSPSMLGLLMLIGAFVMFSGLYGPGVGKFDIWSKEQMPSFFAVRPMATPRFVFIKMIVAGFSALGAWCQLMALLALWAIVEASPWNPRESVVRSALAGATPWEVAVCIAAPLVLLMMSWRGLVVGMWPSLVGRKWFAVTMGVLAMAITALAGGVGYWTYSHRQWWPDLLKYVPWLLAAIVAIKLITAASIFRALTDGEILPPRTIAFWLAVWVSGCIGLIAVASCFVELTPMLAASIVLAVPLARIAAAPMALYFNRHR